MKLTTEEIEILRKLRKILSELTADELKAFSYIWENISVGEILFERELSTRYGISKPYFLARRLREKGLIERGEGCYNLASWLRPLRRKVRHYSELVKVLERYAFA